MKSFTLSATIFLFFCNVALSDETKVEVDWLNQTIGESSSLVFSGIEPDAAGGVYVLLNPLLRTNFAGLNLYPGQFAVARYSGEGALLEVVTNKYDSVYEDGGMQVGEMVHAPDGAVYVSGIWSSGTVLASASLVTKIDKNGHQVWRHVASWRLAGPPVVTVPTYYSHSQVDADGRLLKVRTVDTTVPSIDIVKFGDDGIPASILDLTRSSEEPHRPVHFKVDGKGGSILVFDVLTNFTLWGLNVTNSAGHQLVVKLDSSGSVSWYRANPSGEESTYGTVAGLDVDSQGRVSIAGRFRTRSNPTGPERLQFYATQLSATGDLLWLKKFAQAAPDSFQSTRSEFHVHSDPAGGLVFGLGFASRVFAEGVAPPQGGGDLLLGRFSATGALSWQVQIAACSMALGVPNSVGEVFLAGIITKATRLQESLIQSKPNQWLAKISPRPSLKIASTPGDFGKLTVLLESGLLGSYSIEHSSDLAAWKPLTQVTNQTGVAWLEETIAPSSSRSFYRASRH